MRFTAISFLTAASVALGQTLPLSLFGINLSTQCQQAVLGALSNQSLAQCAGVATLAPLLTGSNSSIIPVLDNFMSTTCYGQPCSNDTLMTAAATITAGCQADIANGTISNSTVSTAFALYPLIREILCLKTTQPYTAQSYGGVLGAPPIPITTYNSTGGYFCVSSLLSQFSAYLGVNITLPYITSIAQGQNSTATNLLTSVNPNVICNGCIFGAVDLIETYYPAAGNVSARTIFGTLGLTAAQAIPANTTLNQAMDSTCAYIPLTVNQNGTLPANISVSIVNSTFPFPVRSGTTL